jgi:hypothetical protein
MVRTYIVQCDGAVITNGFIFSPPSPQNLLKKK